MSNQRDWDLTYWVTHICVGNPIIIGSNNGLSPYRRQVTISTSAGILLTHWGRVTHICVSNLTIIVPDNGLSPDRRQANIWTNTRMLVIRTLGTNFSEILSEIHIFSFKKMHLKMSSAKWWPICLGLNVLTGPLVIKIHTPIFQVLSAQRFAWFQGNYPVNFG